MALPRLPRIAALLPRVALLGLLAGAGCATVPADRGQGELDRLLAGRGVAALPSTATPASALAERLQHELGPADAVALAWQESPRVQAALAELGLAGADLFEAGRLRNPHLSASRIGGSAGKTSVGLSLVVTDLLTLPVRGRIGRERWQAALAGAADTLLAEAAHTRADWYRYVATEQVARLRQAIAEAAAVRAELARRLHAAGNISELQLLREQAAATQARVGSARARADRLAARMALAERLGLVGRSNAWKTSARLPLPVTAALDVDELLAQARSRRPDLAAARAALAAGDDGAALARRFAWLGGIEVGFEREREAGEEASGPTLALELPLFQQGQAARARAGAGRDLAAARLQMRELAVEREVRTGIGRLATQEAIVQAYRDALLPQSETIVARQQERYNFMLIGAFDLIQARQAQFDAHQAYLEAIRDWWLQRTELQRAVGGVLPGDEAETTPAPDLDDLLAPPPGGDPHRHH